MGPSNPYSSVSGGQSLLAQLTKTLVKQQNRKSSGSSFNALEIEVVWQKALGIPGQNMRLWRQDPCGAYMYRDHYGKTDSKWGWEIDHVQPVARSGTDAIANLQALQWQNNRRKGDTVGNYSCAVTYGKA
jgi:5-methylcytosine-specific restriction endonuclease McrA